MLLIYSLSLFYSVFSNIIKKIREKKRERERINLIQITSCNLIALEFYRNLNNYYMIKKKY
jgi:hypothetical protein